MRDTPKFTLVGDMDFDLVALFQVKRVDHGSRKADRQAVAPFRNSHFSIDLRFEESLSGQVHNQEVAFRAGGVVSGLGC